MRGAALIFCVLAACAPIAGQAASPAHDARLLALLFDNARSMEQQLAPAFACVSIREGSVDHDPGAPLIDDLAARWSIPVIPGSRCSTGGQGGSVMAPGVSGTGKWLRVSDLQCTDGSHCTADVSYYVANLGAGGQRVSIERVNGEWRITPSGIRWIS